MLSACRSTVHPARLRQFRWLVWKAFSGPQDAVDMMLNTFDERRKLIVDLLNDVPGFSCIVPKGAFYAFPNITGTGMKSKALEELLLEEVGVATVSGTSFRPYGRRLYPLLLCQQY